MDTGFYRVYDTFTYFKTGIELFGTIYFIGDDDIHLYDIATGQTKNFNEAGVDSYFK